MPIPQFILDRITNAQLSGPRVSELLSNLSAAVDQVGMPGGILTLEFTSDGDRLQPGERSGRAVLSEADVLAIRQSNEGTAKLARDYGVSPGCIDHARRGLSWRLTM